MMSPLRRDVVCTICGLAACVCLVASELDEFTHHKVADRPAVEATMPQQPDHAHEQDHVPVSLIRSDQPGVDGTASEAPPYPPGTLLLDSARVAQRLAQQQRWHPAYYVMSLGSVPPPELAPTPSALAFR
jgi:hypothetical protein